VLSWAGTTNDPLCAYTEWWHVDSTNTPYQTATAAGSQTGLEKTLDVGGRTGVLLPDFKIDNQNYASTT
jgi:hypothetical protein